MNSSNSSFSSRWSLHGQSALVTGGTRGIGRAIVEELANLGAHVYTCARSKEDLTRCLKEWEKAGLHVEGCVCDVSSRGQREALFHNVSSTFKGKLNILVNNVGTNLRKPTVEYTAEDFSHIMSTNFESAYHNAQLAHPLLKATGQGNVVFVSSVAGVTAIRSGTLYAASKGCSPKVLDKTRDRYTKDYMNGYLVNEVINVHKADGLQNP